MIEALLRTLNGPGVNSETRLAAFLDWTGRHGSELSSKPDLFWSGFHQAWNICDDTWCQRNNLLDLARDFRQYLSDFDERPCDHLIEVEDRTFYAALPDRITIYRGCHMDRTMGLAWTTEKATALTFTKGHRGIVVPDPALVSATVAKGAILGAYQTRQECEILVDPLTLKSLRVRFV